MSRTFRPASAAALSTAHRPRRVRAVLPQQARQIIVPFAAGRPATLFAPRHRISCKAALLQSLRDRGQAVRRLHRRTKPTMWPEDPGGRLTRSS